MRFTKKRDLFISYMKDERKIIQKFLWLPLTIGNETRWLETAELEYRVVRFDDFMMNTKYKWEAVKFLND
jgi:hypothetical protein